MVPQKCPVCGESFRKVISLGSGRAGLRRICVLEHQTDYFYPDPVPRDYADHTPTQEPAAEPKPRKVKTQKCKPGSPSMKTAQKAVASTQKATAL
ncbi:MAG: hypothetical protein CEN92_358 [Candidatus Berkelbacteria bacterium Licking1014_96]|uniref:Uncharacterized protein n=1 Tax=Candidatus Berkelbacteria bacterium Licking1014_96 TaxID=2017149 RepID=A0A554LE05_9BACT|nr:MAG: hypothetical protein CEN92_358 [Candidatus Berkelbacteria bacterium Licking1014_96]